MQMEVRYDATLYPLTDSANWIMTEDGEDVEKVTTESQMSVVCPPNSRFCEANYLLMYPSIDTTNVRLAVNFHIDEPLKQVVTFANFFMYTSNPRYTIYLLVLRYSLLLISLISLIMYSRFYCHLEYKNRTFEHRFIMFLSVALVFFNDPLYAISSFYGSIAISVISTLNLAMFMAALLFFWMVMFPRMTFEINKVSTRFAGTLPRVLSLFVFLLISLLVSVQTVYCHFNPSIHLEIQLAHKIPAAAPSDRSDDIILSVCFAVLFAVSRDSGAEQVESAANAASVLFRVDFGVYRSFGGFAVERDVPELRSRWAANPHSFLRLQLLRDIAADIMALVDGTAGAGDQGSDGREGRHSRRRDQKR